jgi:hypothetical protein
MQAAGRIEDRVEAMTSLSTAKDRSSAADRIAPKCSIKKFI